MSTTLTDFITRNGIRAVCRRAKSNPSMSDMGAGARHWRVTLQRGEKGVDFAEMRVPFSQGSAHTAEPTAEDVLDCLAADAAGHENAATFEDWCAEYGYDADSRRAERTYRAVARQSDALESFLGPDLYDSLLWHTERA